MSDHHLILGQLTDYISGDILDDTLDERYRQQMGRLLVEQKGFCKSQIIPRHALGIRVGDKCARLLITYLIEYKNQFAMLIHYGPGSLVTRHRPALAMSRLVTNYQIPVVVITNGEQADVLDGGKGDLIGRGMEGIPDYNTLAKIADRHTWDTINRERALMETRILMAFEVDDRCPCDDSTCKIDTI